MRAAGWIGFSRRVLGQVTEDELFTWAAALAYSWLFAVFPFLIFLLTLLPYLSVGAQDRAKNEIHEFISSVAPGPEAADTIWVNVDASLGALLSGQEPRIAPRLLGLGFALWAASGGMSVTMSALDKCYEIEKGRPYYLQRALALAITLVVIVLILLVVSLLPVGTVVKHYIIHHYLPVWHPLLVIFDIARWTLAVFFLISVLAIVYHKGPSIRHRFVWLSPGAVFSIVVWVGLGLLFRFYVVRFGRYNQTYGTVGGVAVLLLFFYIDALVLLIGAEINSEIDFAVLKIQRGAKDFRYAEDLSAAPPMGI